VTGQPSPKISTEGGRRRLRGPIITRGEGQKGARGKKVIIDTETREGGRGRNEGDWRRRRERGGG